MADFGAEWRKAQQSIDYGPHVDEHDFASEGLLDLHKNVKDSGVHSSNSAATNAAALQDAIDDAGTYDVIYIPPGADSIDYNATLKLMANSKIYGAGGRHTILNFTSTSGNGIQEYTAAQGNTNGGTGIILHGFLLSGDGNSTTGNGIDLGNTHLTVNLNYQAKLSDITVVGFDQGIGFNLNTNAINCSFLQSVTNRVGFQTAGGGSTFSGCLAEQNTEENIIAGGIGDRWLGLHLEAVEDTDDAVVQVNKTTAFTSVDVLLVGDRGNIFHVADADAQLSLRDCAITESSGPHTVTHTVYDDTWNFGTGDIRYIGEYIGHKGSQLGAVVYDAATNYVSTLNGQRLDMYAFGGTAVPVATIDGPVAKIKAGIPSDSDTVLDLNGTIMLDSSNDRIWVRIGDVWKYAALTTP